MGGSIHYVCKGNGKYDVYITAVIDCGGVGISQTNLVAKCSTATVTVSNQTKLSTKDITGIDPKCPLGSKCNGTFQYGFEETIWKMELDLSSYGSSYCDWILSATRCCRSGNLVTGGANTDFMITANLNKCLSSCNSSPYFSAETKNILCYNQDMILNMGVIDTVDSGDSISYDLVAPMDANGGSVLGGNFTPNRPLSFFGFPNFNLQWPAGFRLDPLTGDLLFRPTQLNQVAVIVVEAKEWRKVNGTMTVIGRIRKEFTVFVVACGSKQVRIQPPYSKQACAGEQTCITISTSDDDASDSTRLTLSQGNLNMSFSHNSGTVQYASGQLCWTPDSSKISNIPYVVYVTAYDDNCPLSTTTTRAFSFFVREKPKGALHTEVLDCGRIALDFSLYNQVAGFQFRYSIQDTGRVERWAGSNGIDTARVPPGKYFVQLRLQSNTPCFTYYEDTVEIADYVQLAPLSDSSVCYGGSLTLEGKFSGGKAPYSFEWSSGGSTPQSLSVSNPETFTFYYDSVLFLSVTDSMGCAVNDSLFIKVNPLPQLDLGQDLAVCEGDSILVDAGGDTLGWSYLWKDGSNAQTRHSFADPSLWVQVTDSFGCVNSDTMSIWTNAVDVVGARSTSICLGDTILIEAQNAGSYFWYDRLSYQGDGSDIPLFTGSQLKFPLTASLHLILEGRSSLLNATCFDLDTLSLLTLPLPQVDLGGDQTICQGDSVVLSAPQATGNTY
ncbi:MAG: hypothetical protein LPK45_05030, partial [Bacteroidota bacterium]|nr:hypothetical protein [Bacteroidota bacterium]MDX5430423.1 hypothetical protein [Bacteroidota bacterium]MDX5469182.1 hypothetical protein [Bacteroidota bacterium]